MMKLNRLKELELLRASTSAGVSVLLVPVEAAVAYTGIAIRSGTRDEEQWPEGIAHFVEHMLFKGTQKRKAHHILNRMERVGGELNAYTTKEETFVYTISAAADLARAVELLCDICFHSSFPAAELEREKRVVIDEMAVYEDSPSEMIFDDFESLLYPQHPLGRLTLGRQESVSEISPALCHAYVQERFTADNILFFCMGPFQLPRLMRLLENRLCPWP